MVNADIPSKVAALEAMINMLDRRQEADQKATMERLIKIEIKQDESIGILSDKMSNLKDQISAVSIQLTSIRTVEDSNNRWSARNLVVYGLLIAAGGGLFKFVDLIVAAKMAPELVYTAPK